MLMATAESDQMGLTPDQLNDVDEWIAAQITEAIDIPTIGIGAGPDTDGQVLVINDVLGLSEWAPPIAKQFGDVEHVRPDAYERQLVSDPRE